MSARTDLEATENQANSGVTPEQIRKTLIAQLDAIRVDIEDMSGTVDFSVRIYDAC